MYEFLKAYFISRQNCATFILNLFQSGSSKFCLPFVPNGLDHFRKALQRMERQSTSAFEAANELTTTKGGLRK
jgi:hypothetical protein